MITEILLKTESNENTRNAYNFRMGLSMRVNGMLQQGREMGEEFKYGQTEVGMKVTGRLTKPMEGED